MESKGYARDAIRMILENMDRIVFAGDSVTDMGSTNPVGEGLFDNVGRSYVRIIENMYQYGSATFIHYVKRRETHAVHLVSLASLGLEKSYQSGKIYQ